MKKQLLVSIILLTTLETSCSLFFGNIKPADEKSTLYTTLDLSAQNPEWQKVSATPEVDTSESQPDIVYESKKTSAIISINSACKSLSSLQEQKTLQELTRLLFLGVSNLKIEQETNIPLGNSSALKSTATGKIRGDLVKFETIVLKKNNCLYDFMLVGQFPISKENETDFSRFVSSFQLK